MNHSIQPRGNLINYIAERLLQEKEQKLCGTTSDGKIVEPSEQLLNISLKRRPESDEWKNATDVKKRKVVNTESSLISGHMSTAAEQVTSKKKALSQGCDQALAESGALKTHLRPHTGERVKV